ncbi:tetratricopeptide repeat protein [Gammaproteobacteria bacterium]|nr:tetratricopeptide repeat protein [Gammaproteobacteria bacterium]
MKIETIFSLHQNMQLDEAIEQYQQYITQYPNDLHAQELLATAYAQSGQIEIALERFLALFSHNPKRYSLLNHIALCYKQLGHTGLAEKHWLQLIKIFPMPTAYNNLASLKLSQEEYLVAKHYLLKAIFILPHYADAWFNLGLVYTHLQKTNKAIASLETSAKYGHKKSLYQLGVFYEQQQDYGLAKTVLQQAITDNPDYANAQHALARIYLALEQDEEALAHFIQAQRINPHLPHLMANIAKYFHVKGQYANAIEYWAKVPTDEEPVEEIQYNLGVSYHFMGQHQQAKTYFHAVLKSNPDHIDAHLNLAAIALQSVQRDQAILHYQHVQALQPKREDVNYLLAALLQKQHPTSPPKSYVKNLFDQYAHYYEKHLQSMLRYQVPEEIKLMFATHLSSKVDIALDLGCGSGIMGPIIAPYTRNLIGIDLSPNMLLEAGKKQIYNQLIESCCIKYLAQEKDIHLFIAADLLPYLSDPTPLFNAIYAASKNDAHFIFSFEKGTDASYTLTQHARYQHNAKWLINLLESIGFDIIEHHETTLRYNQNQPVEGSIIMAKTLSPLS